MPPRRIVTNRGSRTFGRITPPFVSPCRSATHHCVEGGTTRPQVSREGRDMLEIGGVEYRVEDMRKLGVAAQKKHGQGLAEATPVGPAGLTWGHLLDPRISQL